MTDKIKVVKLPAGTADVMLGPIVLKTFGGVQAEQAATDWANQIRAELQQGNEKPEEVIAGEPQREAEPEPEPNKRHKWF